MGCLIHRWGEWEDIVNQCRQIRKCQKCGETKTRDKDHVYGKWEYEDTNSCKQMRACIVCGQSENRVLHTFSEWDYYEEDCCTKKRECTRCGHLEYKEECLSLVVMEEEEKCIEVTMCPRCNEVKIKSIDHIWVDDIKSYKDCLQYVIKMKSDKVQRTGKEIEFILGKSNGDTLDRKYLDLSAQQRNLEHDISVNQLKYKNASDYTRGKVCKRCLYMKKMGRHSHFDE